MSSLLASGNSEREIARVMARTRQAEERVAAEHTTGPDSGPDDVAVTFHSTSASSPRSSLSLRPSRASSIISTRTKVSISTLQDDARSIDLVIGEQSFRIARDGSRITSSSQQDHLPPYSSFEPRMITQDDVVSLMSTGTESIGLRSPRGTRSRSGSVASDSTETVAPDHDIDVAPFAHMAELNTRSKEGTRSSAGAAGTDSETRSRPDSLSSDMSTPHTDDTENTEAPVIDKVESPGTSRRQSYWIASVIQHMLKGKSTGSPSIKATELDAETSDEHTSGATEDPEMAALLSRMDALDPLSSEYRQTWSEVQQRKGVTQPPYGQTLPPLPASVTKELPPDPPSDSVPDTDSEVRAHYVDLIRSIDRDYRRLLHDKDLDLAYLRERLNDKDKVLRAQLRNRESTIDELREKIRILETHAETKIEKARHEIEDLWEQRWKDRDHHLMERMRRIEREGQLMIEKAVRKRDEIWKRELGLPDSHCDFTDENVLDEHMRQNHQLL